MTECPVTHFIESALADTGLNVCHQIDPKGNLRTVKRCLLDDTHGTIRHIGYDHIIGLVGGIAEEIALENRLSPLECTFKQLIICTEDRFELLVKGKARGGDM